ncbi:MAG: response regulator [Candidatus Aerophobetes bacterium]|nr:response regulator [Candidatus Aerophobetes bacterium]
MAGKGKILEKLLSRTNAHILVVEDEDIIARDIQNRLRGLGYAVCGPVSSGEEAIKKVEEAHPDLVLMDIVLKGKMDGIEAAEQIRNGFNIPVVYLTAYADESILQRAKITEPFGYILKPFGEKELHTTVEIALYKYKVEEKLKQSSEKLQNTIKATVRSLALMGERRDPYTAGHQQRVTQLACAIAREMHLSEDKFKGIHTAAVIHDIGKGGIPAEILSKPSRLTKIELDMVKTHPQAGYEILKTIEFPGSVAQIVLQHHERMDGSGYPQGLSGNNILLEARILGVADVVEAMSSRRPYREALGIDKALEEISKNKGILYDPQVVDACLKLFTRRGFKFE